MTEQHTSSDPNVGLGGLEGATVLVTGVRG